MKKLTPPNATRGIDHAKIFHDEYLNAKEPELFDTVDHEYNRRKGPRYKQERAYNTANYVSFSASAGDEMMIYPAGSISKGMLANAYVLNEAPPLVETFDGTFIRAHHVYDLDETIGTQNFLDKVLHKNRRMQLQKISLLETFAPERLVLAPIAFQGAISVAGQPNFDLGSKRRDKGFMQLWTPTIREKIDVIFVTGDGFFSGATSGLEYPEAIAIAAGLRKRRPKADMRFLDMAMKDVPLFELCRRYSEYLIWAADDKDFYLKHEPTALMRAFAISTMAERGELPKANPIFLQGVLDNLDAMKKLQREIEPLILERVKSRMFEIDLTDLAAVNPDFVEKCKAIKGGPRPQTRMNVDDVVGNLEKSGIAIHRFTNEELAQGDFELKEIAAKIPAQNYLPLTENDASKRVMRPVDMRGDATRAHDGKSLFSRALLPLTTERERLLASVAVGGLETVSPRSTQRYVYIAADDKYGAATTKSKNALKLAHEDEVPSALGKDFAAQRRANRATIAALQTQMQAEGKHVLSSLDLQKQVSIMAKNPQIAVAAGEAKLGSAARAVVRHTIMARNVTDFCFMPGWEKSNDCVQDIILATRMQLGLQSGAAIDSKQVRVFNEQGHCLTIADRARAIWQPLKEALAQGRDTKDLEEPATALAQLWAFHRLAADPTMRLRSFEKIQERHPDIFLPQDMNWDRIPPFIFAYDHKEFEKLWNSEIKPVLDSTLIMEVRMQHLEHIPDFIGMRAQQEAAIKIAAAGTPES
ncbi:MAG: hypothetical protein WCD70_02200, partial [Alphaproteobacteria bacterium]